MRTPNTSNSQVPLVRRGLRKAKAAAEGLFPNTSDPAIGLCHQIFRDLSGKGRERLCGQAAPERSSESESESESESACNPTAHANRPRQSGHIFRRLPAGAKRMCRGDGVKRLITSTAGGDFACRTWRLNPNRNRSNGGRPVLAAILSWRGYFVSSFA